MAGFTPGLDNLQHQIALDFQVLYRLLKYHPLINNSRAYFGGVMEGSDMKSLIGEAYY